jgi:hypothetical protein
MVEAGQVVEIAVLAEREVGVGRAPREAGTQQERHRVRFHGSEDALASGLVHGRRIPGQGSAAHTTLTSAQ